MEPWTNKMWCGQVTSKTVCGVGVRTGRVLGTDGCENRDDTAQCSWWTNHPGDMVVRAGRASKETKRSDQRGGKTPSSHDTAAAAADVITLAWMKYAQACSGSRRRNSTCSALLLVEWICETTQWPAPCTSTQHKHHSTQGVGGVSQESREV